MIRRFAILAVLAFGSFIVAGVDAFAMKILNIPPVVQSTPSWCWLATGQMIFQYYHVPANAPDFQCGEARFQGAVPTGNPAQPFWGPCWSNCTGCAAVGAGSVQGLYNMLTQYPAAMRIVSGNPMSVVLQQPLVSLSALAPGQVTAEIDRGHPIIAGVSPGAGFMPPGVSEHAILIAGYDNGGAILVVNDPFDYQANGMIPPYLQVGGAALRPGQFAVPYAAMVGPIRWTNAVFNIHP
jgi:hypothetical protein